MFLNLEVVFFMLGSAWIGMSSSIGVWLMSNKIYSKKISYAICLLYFGGVFFIAYYLGKINKHYTIGDNVKYMSLLSLVVFFFFGLLASRRIWKKEEN